MPPPRRPVAYRCREWRAPDATTRQPVAGAVIQLAGLNHLAETDTAGAFRLGGLEPQLVSVRVFHPNYAAVQRGLNLFANRTVQVEYLLTAQVQRLPEVLVVEKPEPTPTARVLEGFEERRRLGAGTFFDQAMLERSMHRRMGDMLREVPTIKLIGTGSEVRAATNRQATRSIMGGRALLPRCSGRWDGGWIHESEWPRRRVRTDRCRGVRWDK